MNVSNMLQQSKYFNYILKTSVAAQGDAYGSATVPNAFKSQKLFQEDTMVPHVMYVEHWAIALSPKLLTKYSIF